MSSAPSPSSSDRASYPDPFQQLVAQSIATLNELLVDETLSARERAAIALQIVKIASNSSSPMPNPPGSGRLDMLQGISSPSPSPQHETDPRGLNPDILPARWVQINGFLSEAEQAQLLAIAIQHAADFVGSTTTTGEVDYRKSSVLYPSFFPAFYQQFQHKILTVLPTVLQTLKHPRFQVSEVEMQMTAHNDGGYYKIHNDSGSEMTATRELTYVYYFYREPKCFSGGELRIYNTHLTQRVLPDQVPFQTVHPLNNSIVFFDSRLEHEVMPIHCASRTFEDSRFTLNGWLRR